MTRSRLYLILHALAALAALLCGGCQLVPTEHTSTLEQKQRENVGQKAGSEFVASVKPDPVHVEVKAKDGSVVSIDQPVPHEIKGTANVAENSDSQASGSVLDSISIPLGVKLILFGVGCLVLLAVGSIILRNRAANAAWNGASDMIEGAIHNVRTMATTSTDPNATSALKAAEAELERLRANVNK